MRKKVVVALVAILVALSFAGAAFAAAKTITGEVMSADSSAKTLMIKAQGQEMTFSVVEKGKLCIVRRSSAAVTANPNYITLTE